MNALLLVMTKMCTIATKTILARLLLLLLLLLLLSAKLAYLESNKYSCSPISSPRHGSPSY